MSIRGDEKEIAATLEAIQRKGYSRLGLDPALFTKKNVDRFSDAMAFRMTGRHDRSWIDKIKSGLPFLKNDLTRTSRAAITRIEHPADFNILCGVIGDIHRAMDALDIAFPSSIRFGTSHSGRFNSAVVSVRDNRFRLIVVESGLFGFANLFAKMFVSCLSSRVDGPGRFFDTSIETARKNISMSSESFRRFSELMTAYVIFGDPRRAPQYMPSQEISSLSVNILQSFEIFSVAHSYGHCIFGHIDDKKNQQRYLLPDIDGQNRPNHTTWTEVFEADYFAATITIQAIVGRGYDIPIALFGIFVFFGAVEVIEQAVGVLNKGSHRPCDDHDVSEGHPTAAVRRATLMKNLEERQSGHIDDFRTASHLGDLVAYIVASLWALLEPSFQESHRAGYRTSYIWENQGVM